MFEKLRRFFIGRTASAVASPIIEPPKPAITTPIVISTKPTDRGRSETFLVERTTQGEEAAKIVTVVAEAVLPPVIEAKPVISEAAPASAPTPRQVPEIIHPLGQSSGERVRGFLEAEKVTNTRPIRRAVVKSQPEKVLHPVAIYFDDNLRKQTVHYSQLANDDVYRLVRRHILYTEDRKKQLQVRLGKNGTGVRHFWMPADLGTKLEDKLKDKSLKETRENDPAHEDRIKWLVRDIEGQGAKQIITYDFDAYNAKCRRLKNSEKPDPSIFLDIDQYILADIARYKWTANKTHFDVAGADVCPDIVGVARDGQQAEGRPKVFIEVINTHFPSPTTWQAYLEQSTKEPLIVLFNYIAGDNAFPKRSRYYDLQARKQDDEKGRPVSDVRVIYYIWQGHFWKNTEPATNGLADEIRLERDRSSRLANGAKPRRLES